MLIRPARVLVRPLVSALAALALAGCVASDARPLYRCLESVTTESLSISNLPPQPEGVFTTGSSTMTGNVFDAEYETAVYFEDPSGALTTLCRRLESELADRCDVVRASSGSTHCSFTVSSPHRATTGEDGVHHHRRMEGRVHLLAEPADDGRTKLLLTAAEWPS